MAENYVDNEKFHNLILSYHERKKFNPKEKIPEEIGKMLMLMANRLATSFRFCRYTFKDEMISDAILRSIEVFDNYDPVKYSRPFAYFTLVMWRTFLQRIKKEKLEITKREKLIMVDEIYSLQEGDTCAVNRDTMLQDYVFNSYGNE